MGRHTGETLTVLHPFSDSVVVTFCVSLWISVPANQRHSLDNPLVGKASRLIFSG
jgi:hypothetical protein